MSDAKIRWAWMLAYRECAQFMRPHSIFNHPLVPGRFTLNGRNCV